MRRNELSSFHLISHEIIYDFRGDSRNDALIIIEKEPFTVHLFSLEMSNVSFNLFIQKFIVSQ